MHQPEGNEPPPTGCKTVEHALPPDSRPSALMSANMTSQRVLIVSHDVVGQRMAGPGIRYAQLARVLAAEFTVVLAAPTGSTHDPALPYQLMLYDPDDVHALEAVACEARAVVLPWIWLSHMPFLEQLGVPLVIDGYDPVLSENLAMGVDNTMALLAETSAAIRAGDFFMCASERQRDWWLGLLEAHGRISPEEFAADHSLRRLVDVVAFGLPETLPQHTRRLVKGVWTGIGVNDRVVLWGGGLWAWLDPFTAIRAVAQLYARYADVRLIFPGTLHPNPSMTNAVTHTAEARALAKELGVLDRAVFFGDWIAYDDWPNVLLESDVALTLHQDSFEARLAFRSRVLDYIWAGVPIVATRGDSTSELIGNYQLGRLVNAQDVGGVAQALQELLETDKQMMDTAFELARKQLNWKRVVEPLLEFCRNPRVKRDNSAMVIMTRTAYDDKCQQWVAERNRHEAQHEQLITAYAKLESERSQLTTQCRQLESERSQSIAERNYWQSLVGKYQQGRFMRLMRLAYQVRQRLRRFY
jgi:glycosyltransferase involved in cell wall biosynthesis